MEENSWSVVYLTLGFLHILTNEKKCAPNFLDVAVCRKDLPNADGE
jgi:hypothetical protein